MRCIVRSVPWDAERLGWAEGLAEELPNATLVLDRQRSAF